MSQLSYSKVLEILGLDTIKCFDGHLSYYKALVAVRAEHIYCLFRLQEKHVKDEQIEHWKKIVKTL